MYIALQESTFAAMQVMPSGVKDIVETFSSGYFDPASSKSPLVMCRSVQTVFRKSYVSCKAQYPSIGFASLLPLHREDA